MRTRGRNLLLMLTFSSSPLFAVQFPPAQGKAPGIGQPAQSPSIPRTAQGQQPHVDKGGPAEEIVSLIQSSRPLDAAIRELRWFGIPISYEEPVWQSRDDIVPQGPVSGNPNRDPEVLVPARAALLLRFQVDAATRTHLREPMATILNELVSRHQGAGNPGEFRVIDLGGDQGYSIVPIRVKDSSGAMASAGSPLEWPISIETRARTFEETLDAFVKAVSQVSGRRIVFFDTTGSRLLAENHTEPLYTFGADKEVARSVLGRLLSQAFEQKMAWRLVHQPGKPGEAPISERVPGTRGSDPPKLLTGSTTAVQLLPRGGVTQTVEDYYGLSFAPVVQQVDRSQLKADGSGRVVRPVLWPNWDRAGSIK